MSVHLRDHQIRGAARIARQDRMILGWEPGTGKTYAAFAAAVRPVLIVAPAYLMFNWYDAATAMQPEWTTVTVTGTPAMKHNLLGGGYDVTIVSYNLIADATYREVHAQHWGTIIYDEAHALRGYRSQRTKAAYHLHGDRIILATGTPVYNTADDLFPLLKICDPKRFTSYWNFVNEWLLTKQTPWATEIVGVRDPAAFQKMLEPYLDTLALSDVVPELPDAVWTNVTTLLTPQERKDHDTAKREYIFRGTPLKGAGALVPALRGLTAASKNKIEATKMLLADHPERVVVWTWYRESAKVVAECCVPKGKNARPVFMATGDESPAERHKAVKAFCKSKGGVLIATIASLGEGYNLQDSSTAVFYELSYIPSQNQQVIRRQQRQGQKGVVRAYIMMADHSVDQAVYRLAQRKGQRNSEAIGDREVLEELRKLS